MIHDLLHDPMDIARFYVFSFPSSFFGKKISFSKENHSMGFGWSDPSLPFPWLTSTNG